MDIALMKQDFYKRFSGGEGYLRAEKCGLLCTLLGFPRIKGALSLTYPLSVGVTGLCRPTGSDSLNLESTGSDVSLTRRVKNGGILPEGAHLTGGQILLNNDIPEYFNSSAETSCCTVKCVMSMNNFPEYDKTAAAASCCGRDNIKPYLALLNARPGYCIRSERLKTELLPLPLSGFRLVSIQPAKRSAGEKDFAEIEHEFERLRSFYPHLTSLSELTQQELDAARHRLKSKTVYRRMCMILRDNERIRAVSEPLRRCRTSELFNMMNQSSKDLLRLWEPDTKRAVMLRSVLELEGVRAARLWSSGVIAAVYEERTDYIISAAEAALGRTSGDEIKFCVSS
ncbi:MAG TPA: hypothetical protein IAA60_04450 [Candidatus Ornithomonoglobus intestinigallinarum]|uniref:Uncharacterized protein n=1 Tax=Candidatus Ornithomonoglobus intestinigallinarum TaxID=2840894 RepID=A0A9D1KR16_9FIRM|nr:hypothetical protein [Candidatus Ornithomonoglobus intestinigallinarum]